MALANQVVAEKIALLAQRIADPFGIEIVDVELLGGGVHRVLRVTIDRDNAEPSAPLEEGAEALPDEVVPVGVTHGDCEKISRTLGDALDEGDIIAGGSYTLEVTSPGVDRKLTKPRDFERFVGQKIKVALKQPLDGEKRFEGVLEEFQGGVATLAVKQGKAKEPKVVKIPYDGIEKANLKFEWK